MNEVQINEIALIGIGLKNKTINENGKSVIDCGNLWQKFQSEKIAEKIPGKLSSSIFAVYYDYEADHTKPFSYFIGCKVNNNSVIPEGMNSLLIPEGNYKKILAKGKIPDCISDAWKEIWISDIPREYKVDFEIYNEKSKDLNNAEVEIYLSVKN